MRKVTKQQLRRFPELAIVEDEEAQSELLMLIRGKHVLFWILPAALVAAILLLAVKFLIGQLPLGFDPSIAGLLAPGVAGAVLGPLAMYWARNDQRRTLRSELRRLAYPICLNCGYDMRGLPHDRCPECGEVGYPSPTENERA